MTPRRIHRGVAALCVAAALALLAGRSEAMEGIDELKKLKQFSYGHAVVEGGVHPYEYFRATFGGPMPCGRFPLVLADNELACEELDPERVRGAVVLILRGVCPFVTKAVNANNAGAAGVVVSNHEGGLIRMPMGNLTEGLDINVPVVMVNNNTGSTLRRSLVDNGRLMMSWEPQAAPCLPQAMMSQWPTMPRPFTEIELLDAEEAMDPTDTAKNAATALVGAAGTDQSGWFEGATADFGAPIVPTTFKNTVVAEPADACEELLGDLTGALAVTFRGKCAMIYKVRHLQKAGARAVLIINMESEMGVARASPDDVLDVTIPVVMISASSWAALSALPDDTPFSWRGYTAQGTEWKDAEDVTQIEAADWPDTAQQRRQWLDEMVANHHPDSPTGHWQRWEAVEKVLAAAKLDDEATAAIEAMRQHVASAVKEPAADPYVSLAGAMAPLLLRDTTHHVLDAARNTGASVRGSQLICSQSNGRHVFHTPTFKRSAPTSAELHLKETLRQQLCLERLLLQNAIAAGKTARYLQTTLERDAYSSMVDRVLREIAVKGEHKETVNMLVGLGLRAQRRHLVDSAVTVGQWLADDLSAGEDESADKEAAAADGEAQVGADGEWSV